MVGGQTISEGMCGVALRMVLASVEVVVVRALIRNCGESFGRVLRVRSGLGRGVGGTGTEEIVFGEMLGAEVMGKLDGSGE